MSKSGLKAFVYSFSVSLFAIMCANRAVWHSAAHSQEPLEIGSKNIVLFLKNNSIAHSPTKKISLNVLPKLKSEVSPPLEPQPEVILASALDEVDFPLEFISDNKTVQNQQFALAEVLYAPDIPLAEPTIEAAPVYAPEQTETQLIKAPKPAKEVKIAIVENTPKKPAAKKVADEQSSENKALLLARAANTDNFPLQKSSDAAKNGNKISFGNPQTLNGVALSSENIPIHSMEKDILPQGKEQQGDWKQLNDSPWLIAKSGGVPKNRLAAKEFEGKSFDDIAKPLNTEQQRGGFQVASETAKNLIIPIPEKIMEDKNLTPKLAYPSTSEDAEKEKVIDAAIKQKEDAKDKTPQEQKLLSPIDEDVSLDAPAPITPIAAPKEEIKEEPKKAEERAAPAENKPASEKGGLMTTLNSIFSSASKNVSEAKEKAIAKAQAKRSFKKRIAKNRPVSIMPTEIRLSFQPNRAEISGQTLRWVQAFAAKAAELPHIALEIRIDGTGAAGLQQKRLNLLHNILTNKGVEYSKINTVFTTREPNSFILRTINLENRNSGRNGGKTNNASGSQYIQW